jgi:DNA-binding cell septation regulator SpoVG
MKITRIELKVSQSGSLLAYGTIEFNEILVTKFRYMKRSQEDKKEYFHLGSSDKGKDNKWYDCTYSKGQEFRESILNAIEDKYFETLDELSAIRNNRQKGA